ncbi:MAG: DUF481 domain-containing protein [Thermotogae bacterium]|nr:DUF481 domain-containing protein [Thermotogota bacterium]
MLSFVIAAPLTFSANINGNLVYGNTESSLLGGKIALTRDVFPWEYEISLSGAYGTAKVGDSTEITANNLLGLMRFDRYVRGNVEAFIFGSSEFNRVMNLENRTEGGAGVKYVFIKTESAKFSVSTALLGGYEKYVGDTVSRYPIRLSVRPMGNFNFGPLGKLSFVLFYQPNIQAFSQDYRIFGDITYNIALGRFIALNFILKYNYDGYIAYQSKDPNSSLYGVKPYEINFLAGFSLSIPLEGGK